MEIRKGIGVSPGYGVESVFILDTERFFIPKRFIEAGDIKTEIERLHEAIASAQSEILDVQKSFAGSVGEETASIFDAHMWMIEDKKVKGEIVKKIKEEKVTTEYAVSRVFRRYAKLFSGLKDGYLNQRVSDIHDNETRLLRHLLGKKRQTLESLDRRVILVAHELSPSQTAMLNPEFVLGIAVDQGGPTSHTAIMARALQIPCVVGLKDISTDVAGGDIIALDGGRGVVIIGPDEATYESYQKKGNRYHEFERQLLSETENLSSTTKDGTEIEMLLNIEDPSELEAAHVPSHGVGLFRTEFLYMNRSGPLDEEAHFKAYRRCLKSLDGKPLVVRTLDLGGDKIRPGDTQISKERNPILGCRSIRLSFEEPSSFRVQLRACLRAAVEGDLRIMFPLISSIEEIRRARQFLEDVREELAEEGVTHNGNVKVGMMIEVPSAALLIDRFINEVDFFSIGTNDLVQYTLAVDRTNERVANLYSPSHPAHLRLIKQVVDVCNEAGKPLCLCGEMAGDIRFTELLLGLGVRQLSMLPVAVPEVKKMVSTLEIAEARKLSGQCLDMDDAESIYKILETRSQSLMPDIF